MLISTYLGFFCVSIPFITQIIRLLTGGIIINPKSDIVISRLKFFLELHALLLLNQ